MSKIVRSTDVLEPIGRKPRSYVRERVGFGDVMTEREAKIIEYEERLRDLKAQLDELERKASRSYRPCFAAGVRFVTLDELKALPVYSR